MKLNYLKSSLLIAFIAICAAFSFKKVYTGLPTSGQITMDMIRAELGVPSQANFSLVAARNGVYAPLNPYSPTLPPATGQVKLSDWYGYCHTCTTIYTHTVYIADYHVGNQGFVSASAACSGNRDYPQTVYSSSSTLSAGATLFTLSSGVYYPFTVSDTDQWIWSNTGTKPIQMNGSNTISTVGACGYTVNWSFEDNPPSSGRTLLIYKNGSLVVNTSNTDSGSFSCDPGDTIRVLLSVSLFEGYANAVTITGGYTFSSSNSSDTDIDTGTVTPSGGTVNILVTINN
jgi:hypothetical protein